MLAVEALLEALGDEAVHQNELRLAVAVGAKDGLRVGAKEILRVVGWVPACIEHNHARRGCTAMIDKRALLAPWVMRVKK